MNLFEEVLSVCSEDIEFELRGFTLVEWSNFLLNPRRLRGSDFLMRWSQGVWSEHRILEAVNKTDDFFAIPYGPSGTAPNNDVRAFELYFERLEQAGLGAIKRPDLLVFEKNDQTFVRGIVDKLGGLSELPFTSEENSDIKAMLAKAIVGVECENSLWIGQRMPDYGTELKPQRRLGGKRGLKKNAVLPTIILKEEDCQPLQIWQDNHKIPIHIWHVFYDIAYGIAYNDAKKLIQEGHIEATEQVFQSPGGATTKKIIYKIYYQHGYLLGTAHEDPRLIAKHIVDKNGHILPYVHFEGGAMSLKDEALDILRSAADKKSGR